MVDRADEAFAAGKETGEAYKAGKAAAEKLKIGDVFTGAFGAFAETTIDYTLRSAFTAGYLAGLRRPVRTDLNNRITQLGPAK